MKRLALSIPIFVALVITGAFTFDGAPPSPLPYQQVSALDGWDVMVHQRAVQDSIEPVVAQHGGDCSGYPSTHLVDTFDAAVFQCNNHIMTAINSDVTGYAAIYLTPPELLDWSAGEAVISWDISTLVTSSRDWWDVTISSWDSNMSFPLLAGFPDGTGTPLNSWVLRLRPEHMSMCPEEYVGGAYQDNGCNLYGDYSAYITPSATVRTTFEARITADHLKVWMPSTGLIWYDGPNHQPYTQGVVQFGHHSYTPSKDNAGTANTWHWDNITLNPSIPFTINRASPVRQYVSNWDTDTTVSFPAASAGARLRFTSIGDQALVNGQVCNRQPGTVTDPWGHAASFFCPIPEGSTSATIRGVRPNLWPLGNVVEGVHVWAPGGGGGLPSPTATATQPAPTATNTVAPPTATPIPPTATPVPPRYRCQIRQGTSWVTVWDRVGGGSCP